MRLGLNWQVLLVLSHLGQISSVKTKCINTAIEIAFKFTRLIIICHVVLFLLCCPGRLGLCAR